MAPRAVTMIFQAVVCILLVVAPGVTSDEPVQLSESFGGPHGNEFSDQKTVAAGQTVGSITIRAGERVDGVSLEVTGPTPQSYTHGGDGGTENTLKLGAGEVITSMEAHWGKKNDHTRIFYLSFGTSAGNSVSGGSTTDDKNTVTAPEGFQLAGFFGNDGNEIDSLGAIWARVAAETAPPATTAPAPAATEAPAPAPAPTKAPAASSDTSASGSGTPASGDASGSEAPSSDASSGSEAPVSGDASATSSQTQVDSSKDTVVQTAPPATSEDVSTAGSATSADSSASEDASAAGSKAPDSDDASADGSEAPASDDASATSSQTQVDSSKDTVVQTAAPVASEDVSTAGSAASGDSSASGDTSAAGSEDPAASGDESIAGSATSGDSSAAGSEDSAAGSKAPTSGDASATGSQTQMDVSTAGSKAPTASGNTSAAGSGAPAPSASAVVVGTETPAPAPAATEAPAPTGPSISIEDSVQLSESFGGPHGTPFSDEPVARSGQKITSLSLHAGERLDGLTLEIAAPKKLTVTHGGTGGDEKKLTLADGEYITSMEVHWGKKNDHTRIFYANFVTSAGNSLSGGSMTDDKSTVTAPAGFQLGGFFGNDGKEIDTLGAVWTSIEAVTVAPAATPAPAPPASAAGSGAGTVAPVDPTGSAAAAPKKNTQAVQLSESFGGPHGEQFSDQASATSGQTIGSITVRAGERVDGVALEVTSPNSYTITHGGTGGTENTLKLGDKEYITSMEAHWGQKGGHTRIFYLSFTTSAGNSVAGGSQTDEKGTVTAPEGYQLGGFFGRFGDEIDLIGAVWTNIEAIAETPAPAVSADEDISLSELFGGPHGVAFSDINKLKFGQKISSITIRSDKRVDAVTLQVASPVALTLNHGGGGGTEKTLTLGDSEYINSIEAHWGKKNDHTRVFYLSIGTSAGNTLAGGTQTEDKGTATAPEGFQLGGFYGRSENEVDQIGAIWTRIGATDINLNDIEGIGNGTYGTTIRNWVGPTIGDASDTACYRKTTAFDRNNICPLGFGKDGDDCLAQCPLSYPVSCGAECIPQNDDCALEVLMKVGSVLFVALNALSGGVMGEVKAAFMTLKWGIACAANIVSVVRSFVYYMRYQQTAAPQTDTEKLLAVAYQADVVLIDIPRAVCVCLNIPVPKGTDFADIVLQTVEGIVKQAITNGDEIVSTGKNVMNLLSGASMNTSSTTVDELQDLIDKNSSCGYELKRLTDRVIDQVLDIRNKTPDTSAADTRVIVYKSTLVLNEIPFVTNNCMGELLASKTLTAAYQTRDMLRKTFAVIVDQLIDTGKTDMGKDVADDEYLLKVANMGLVGISALDPTGIAYMASQFVQPICGPTAYLGEINDGTLNDALGLTTVDEAFEGSYGSWTQVGDGVIHLIFESVDTKDVTVVIHSGGDDYDKVDVGSGDTVVWDGTLSQMQDKQMYLDRWRPGLFGLPGSGGGSLLLWIPRSSQGGHITMHVRINPS